jgi:hypothetical protein
MSIHAFLFFLLSITLAVTGVCAGLSGGWELVAKGGAVLFGAFFVVSLLIGRRIKFDPMLR